MFVNILLDAVDLGILIYAFAFCFAGFESEAEGKGLWAKFFPTWRVTPETPGTTFFIRVMKIIARITKKPVTGYHLYIILIVPLIFHLPFPILKQWSIELEFRVMMIYFTFISLWDFIWFIINPNFTLKKFQRQYLYSFSGKWLGRVPMDYIASLLLSIVVAGIWSWYRGDYEPMMEYTSLLIIWFILLTVTMLFSKKYHAWYWRMRESTKTS